MLKSPKKLLRQPPYFSAHSHEGVHLASVRDAKPEIYVGRRRLSHDSPAFIVAEIGLNHGGQFGRAVELIEAAAESGAEAVKFQKRSPRALLSRAAYDQPYHNGGHSFGATYGEHREALEFSIDQYRELKTRANALGLEFFASVWDIPSLDEVSELGVPVIKIGSADLTNEPLINVASSKGIPLFVSTGMSEFCEIDNTVSMLKNSSAPFVLFHCVSLYPTPPELSKLSTLSRFTSKYNVPVGYSGHETDISIAVAARVLGACVIEKHFTVDRRWKGGDQKTSLMPDKFSQMVKEIRVVEKALTGYRVDLINGEDHQRRKLAKSIVAACDLIAGEVLMPCKLAVKSPGGGVSPQNLELFIGRTITRAVKADEYVLFNDLEPEE